MKKLIKSAEEFAELGTRGPLTGPCDTVKNYIYNYVKDCYESIGLDSKYPSVNVDYNFRHGEPFRPGESGWVVISSVYVEFYNKDIFASLFNIEVTLVQIYRHEAYNGYGGPCLGAVNAQCSANYKLKPYGISNILTSGHPEDALDYVKRNKVPQKSQVSGLYMSMNELLPKQQCIKWIREFLPVCYDSALDLQEREQRAKDEQEKQEQYKLSQFDLQGAINRKIGTESNYQIGVRIYNDGAGSSVNSEYTEEFTAPGDYFALFYLANGHKDVDVEDIIEEFDKKNLKEWLTNNKTVKQLVKDRSEWRYPDEYTEVMYMKNLDTGKYIFGSNRNFIESSYDAHGLVIL